MWHSVSGLEVDLGHISFNQVMDIFWNIIIINIINYFKSCVFLLGKIADCSSFFQLCVKNVFTFSGIKDWKRVKFLTKGLFSWRWKTADRWGNMWLVTPPIM